ncbi:MAG: integrase family protein [Dechloromonas sp.]|nr:integrase family protein [Dechloromonas sp.]
MARVKLTAGRIDKFVCPEGKAQAFLHDSDTPGLCIRATKGARAFVFQSRLRGGETFRRTIGDIRSWKIDEAREEAGRLQRLVDKGLDPRELDREAAEAKRNAQAAKEAEQAAHEARRQYTLKSLCETYCTYLEAKGKKGSARHARSIFKVHVFNAHPAVAEMPANDITAYQVAALVRAVAEQGKERTAGILRAYLNAAFSAARKAPFDAKLPSTLIPFNISNNPVEPIPTIAVQRGNRTLSSEELATYVAALGANLADQALKLQLFAGGQRMAQLLRVQVSDFDPETRVLRLWDGKGKRTAPREHLLPLGPKAAVIVKTLIVRAKKLGTTNLFSTYGREPLADTSPGKRAQSIARTMECAPFDLRDIRRTCETMLAGMGINRDIRAQLLSHGLSGVQNAHYDRHSYIEEKRSALVAWEQKLTNLKPGKRHKPATDAATNITH